MGFLSATLPFYNMDVLSEGLFHELGRSSGEGSTI